MKKYRVSTKEIENIFHFMNLFSTSELIRYKYTFEKETNEHIIIFEFGMITKARFNNCVKKFKMIFGDLIKVTEIEIR